MCYVINQELSKSPIVKHSWNCNHNFNFQNPNVIINTNHTSELDFLENFSIYFNHEVIDNEKSDFKKLSET